MGRTIQEFIISAVEYVGNDYEKILLPFNCIGCSIGLVRMFFRLRFKELRRNRNF